MEQWYTVHTKPNAEYQVIAALERREFQTYLPEIVSSKTKKGLTKKPFFPCYLFVRADFNQLGLISIRWIPGIHQIVAFDEHPVPIPDEIIGLIRHKLSDETTSGDVDHGFKPGDQVRIKNGPFREMLAIFDGPTSPAQRVQVLLEILGQARRVKLKVTDIEKTSTEPQTPVQKRLRLTRGRGRPIHYTNQNKRDYQPDP